MTGSKHTAKPSATISTAPKQRAWVVAQEVCEKLAELSKDDQRRVLAASATLLGLYEENES